MKLIATLAIIISLTILTVSQEPPTTGNALINVGGQRSSDDQKKKARVGKSTVLSGFFLEQAIERTDSGPAIIAVDESDTVWTALAKSGKLARYTNGSIILYDIGAESRPVGLAVGSDANGHPGKIWIAASYDNKILCFDVLSKLVREYKIDGDNSWPFNIAIGKNGEIWFSQRAAGKIGRLNPVTGKVRHFEIATLNSGPAGLAVNPIDASVWFTESYANKIGRLDPASGEIKEFAMSGTTTGLQSGPAGLAVDVTGGVWFAKLEGKLGHIAAGSEIINEIDVPTAAKRPAGIAIGPNGDVWIAALDGNLLLRYDPKEHIFSQYPLPTGSVDNQPSTPPFARSSRPFGIAVDKHGNVWFSEQYTGQLGALDLAPPTVKLYSPSDSSKIIDPFLTMFASDTVSGISRTEILLNGHPVKPVHGRLDLYNLKPGKFSLRVTVMDRAGWSSTIDRTLIYEPSLLALQGWIDRLTPKSNRGESAKEELRYVSKGLAKGDLRENLLRLSQSLDGYASLFRKFDRSVFDALVQFQVQSRGATREISILDEPPYFSPDELTVSTGDTVAWRYTPPSSGHAISHNLHQIEIEGVGVRSELLRAGGTFSYRFVKAGVYKITNMKNMKSCTIRVIAK